MRKFRTGDIYFENTWTLKALLNRSLDPETRWSNAGFILVDEDPKDPETPMVNVCMLIDGELQIQSLEDVLRRPEVQAACCRQLQAKLKVETSRQIKNYLKSFLIRGVPILEVSTACRQLLQNVTDEDLYVKANNKIPGFQKGLPSNPKYYEFTPENLIASTLAQAELITYDPNLPMSAFQEGSGDFDRLYGEEHFLLTQGHRNGKDDHTQRDLVIKLAQEEAAILVAQYFDLLPSSSYRDLHSKETRNGRGILVETQHEEMEKPRGLEQMSNYVKARKRQETASIAEEKRTNTQERKIRQLNEQKKKHTRPKPHYK